MNAPTSPAKFAGGCVAPAVKNQVGSLGSNVTSATIQRTAAANRPTPRNSLARRVSVEAPATQISMMTGSTSGVRPLLYAGPLNHLGQHLRAVGEQRFVARVGDETTRDDLGRARERAIVLADGHDWQRQPVHRQVAAVAQHFVTDLAHARTVD